MSREWPLISTLQALHRHLPFFKVESDQWPFAAVFNMLVSRLSQNIIVCHMMELSSLSFGLSQLSPVWAVIALNPQLEISVL